MDADLPTRRTNGEPKPDSAAPNENDQPTSPSPRPEAPDDSVESAARYLERATRSVRDASSRTAHHSASIEALLSFAEKRRLIFCQDDLPRSQPIGGEEHHVWPNRDNTRVFKITRPNKFGLTIGVVMDATADEYFARLHLTNEVFGDDIRFEGILIQRNSVRTVISQPRITGVMTTPDEIEFFMLSLDFEPVELCGKECWYREADNVLAFDTHTHNFLTTPEGPVPIDVNLLRPANEELAQLISDALTLIRAAVRDEDREPE